MERIPESYAQVIKNRLTPHFNQQYAFFIDLEKPSNEYRFYVLNLVENKIINRGLCCNGKTDSKGNVIYSNVPNSFCSSKGAYKIGSSYVGKFGKAFKLHGQDSTNSNAYIRNVVLHSFTLIPRRLSIFKLFQSEGCPTVNPGFLKELDYYITNSKLPILLYIN